MSNINTSSGNENPASGSSNSGGNSTGDTGGNSVIELTENSMVRLPGAKDPVRYGDHYRGFQSEFTKRSQETARSREQVATLTQQLQRFQQQQQQQPPQQAPNPNVELAQQLKQLPYLKGEDAARLTEHIANQLAERDKSLEQRDLAISLMYKQMKQLASQVTQLTGRTTNSDFDSKMATFAKQGGNLPINFVKELYMAYEGDDLDAEFPRILRERVNELNGHFKNAEKTRVELARRQPFVPGKGGNGSAGKPLNLARASSKQLADAFFPGGENNS